MSRQSPQRAVLVMAKAPFPGEVKTRLANVIGPGAAAELQRAFLLDTLAALAGGTWAAGRSPRVGLVVPDRRHADALRTLIPSTFELMVQPRPGLMAGIAHAFSWAEDQGIALLAVTEADSPSLPPGHVAAAFELLEGVHRGVSLGPCDDGGYYLVAGTGLSAGTAADLFEGQSYESSTICAQTVARARSRGIYAALGPTWYDVDTVDELGRLQHELAGRDDGVEHTRRLLASWPPSAGRLDALLPSP
ncbi:MAG TPA: TIGR04282 family arsenosugar biosynthesis glycosyltransferase [Chloroflexota bacterium]|nr:TIGR04282 family arsenosugar biosynthesis glycosyltransferase [Chloroflexota bacterium]